MRAVPEIACSACGAENPEGAKFCGSCGAALAAACPSCSHRNAPGTRFCTECGSPLVTAALAPDFSSPASYTPPLLAEKIRAARSELEGERKQITVMFTDVAGFTRLSESLDPEETHAIMRRCFDVMLAEVHRYEGTVSQFLGRDAGPLRRADRPRGPRAAGGQGRPRDPVGAAGVSGRAAGVAGHRSPRADRAEQRSRRRRQRRRRPDHGLPRGRRHRQPRLADAVARRAGLRADQRGHPPARRGLLRHA